jgi:PASTA domain
MSGHPDPRLRLRPRGGSLRLALKVLGAALAAAASLVAVLQFVGITPSDITVWPGSAVTVAPIPSMSTAAPERATKLVPSVHGLLEAQARAILRTAGFQLRVQYASAVDGGQVGRVLAQAPPAGSPLSRGGRVAIVVGSADGG